MELSTKKSKSKHKISISSISTIDSSQSLTSRISLRVLSNAISTQIQQFFRFRRKKLSKKSFQNINKISQEPDKQTEKTIQDRDFWLHLLKKMNQRMGPIRHHLDYSYILFKNCLLSLSKKRKEIEPKQLLFTFVACFSLSFKYLEDDLCCNNSLSRLFYISTKTLMDYEVEVFFELLQGRVEVSWEDLDYEVGVLRMLFF